MREAAIERPRVAARSRQGKASPAKRGLLRTYGDPTWRMLRRHPGKSLAAVACTVMMGAIAGNAILLQKGRHPAPLFGSASPGPTEVTASVPVPQPVSRPLPAVPAPAPASVPMVENPAPKTAPALSVMGKPVPPSRKPERHAAASQHPSAAHKPDGITRLLAGDPRPAAAPDEASVIAAQTALGKLGYGVKPDGQMGAATRQALEKFGRDRHLNPGAELSPKLLRELERASGAPRG